ncbi:heavy-metal-associated domain-containing protein [Lactococcus insecticola]|uniref:Mercuric reductase n=1 Tax=Pseudolactococcus insecticola TaxID=2709158 RepID=A0A6A0B4N4_9LACT|nr:cation transporter [Lactococcus insecticola]GFH40320.1 mercuric reductase [Lactococcus insecticola]
MTKTVLKIDGMTCNHCVMHVTEALESVSGVKSAKVNLKKGEAVVKSDSEILDLAAASVAVAAAGYKVV